MNLKAAGRQRLPCCLATARKTMHKNLPTVEGMRTRFLCSIRAEEGGNKAPAGYVKVGGENLPMIGGGENELVAPATPAGDYLYELRAGGTVVLWGQLCARPSAFPPEGEYRDIEVSAVLEAETAIEVQAELREGPRGEKGERGEEGPRGYSAYEVACQEGFKGTEAEWLESIRQQTATLAVGQVTPLMERAERAAENAEEREKAAGEQAQAASGAASMADAARAGAQDAQRDAEMAAEAAGDHAEKAAGSAADALSDRETANNFMRQAGLYADAAEASAEEVQQTKASMEEIKAAFTAAIPPAEQVAKDLYDTHFRQWLLEKYGVERYEYERLADENKVVVHTDRLTGQEMQPVEVLMDAVVPQGTEVVHFNHNAEVSWRNIDRYAECTTIIECHAIAKALGFKNMTEDITSDGELCYHLPQMGAMYMDGSSSFMDKKALKVISCDLPLITNLSFAFRRSGVVEYTGALPNCEALHYSFSGCTSLSRWRTELPKLKQYAAAAFDGCILDKESVLIITGSIPAITTGQTLCLGIHVDHKADADVLAAIDAATAKGWTVTVQWNGTATASTFALRPGAVLPVWARCEVCEGGGYADGDGVEYGVCWGHAVAAPGGRTAAELGYEEYASIEDALSAWGLTEYEAEG